MISVITAVYNCRNYLKDCIKSVRSQTFEDYEHVILDDCSKDGSFKYLRKITSGNSKIRLYKSDHRLHCGSAYAKLASMAKGDIVAVLDADDALVPTALETLNQLYNKYPEVGYIWSQFWLCDSHLKKIKRGFSQWPENESLLEVGLRGKHYFSHWRTFRKDILNKASIFKDGLKAAVDKYMAYSMEEVAIGGFINIPLYRYRCRFGGLSYTGRKNWAKMKVKFKAKREEKNIKPFPILKLDI